jgi:hypothetical protein
VSERAVSSCTVVGRSRQSFFLDEIYEVPYVGAT